MALSKLTRKSYIRFILINLLLALLLVYLHGRYRFTSSRLADLLHLIEAPTGVFTLHDRGSPGWEEDLQALKRGAELYGQRYVDAEARILLQRLEALEPDAGRTISDMLKRSLYGPNIYQVAALDRLVAIRERGGLAEAALALRPVGYRAKGDPMGSALFMMVEGPDGEEPFSGKRFFLRMVNSLWEEDIRSLADELKDPALLYDYLIKNVGCVADEGQYSQTPVETYLRGAGDCEDHAIFAAYFLERAGLNGKAMLILWDEDSRDNGHVVPVFYRGNGYRFADTCGKLGLSGPFKTYDDIFSYIKEKMGRPSHSYYIMEWDRFLEVVP